VDVRKLNIDNSSPLIVKICKILDGNNEDFNLEKYLDWERKKL
jgi:hypothetical protein